ncbi:hypothetical protein WDU94_003208 [Cyamophila willieti]
MFNLSLKEEWHKGTRYCTAWQQDNPSTLNKNGRLTAAGDIVNGSCPPPSNGIKPCANGNVNPAAPAEANNNTKLNGKESALPASVKTKSCPNMDVKIAAGAPAVCAPTNGSPIANGK